jgi:hypothetical protein
LLIYGLCVFLSAPTIAQESQTGAPPAVNSGQEATPPPKATEQPAQKAAPTEPETQPKKNDKKKPGKLDGLVVAPLPISSPAIGSGIVPVIGYIFPFSKSDKVSPPSAVGVAGLITNNGSRGFAIGEQFFLKENTYEITSGFARGNVDYNIYGTGIAANASCLLHRPATYFSESSFGALDGNSLQVLDLSQDARILRSDRAPSPAFQFPPILASTQTSRLWVHG